MNATRRDGSRAERFVGRTRELRDLRRLLARVPGGQPATVVVIGEPGIGKTRFLEQAGELARELDFEVLTGRAFELESDRPFGVVADALDGPFAKAQRLLRERLGPDKLADIAVALPSIAAERASGTAASERSRGHHAIRIALEALASRQPLLIVLDDLHWADSDSLEVISQLMRRGVPGAMLAMGYDARRAPRALTGVVARMSSEDGLRSVELGPLSRSEASGLLGSALASEQVDLLYADSGGNPFLLTRLARAGRTGASRPPFSDDGPAGRPPVPAEVREAIAVELDARSADARRLAQAVAVVGESADLDLAAHVAELGETSTYPAVDELLSVGLLRETAVPGRLTFRHPVVGQATYETAGSGWVLGAHRRAAQALAERGAAAEVRAHHVERSAAIGDEEAIALLTDVARAAAMSPAAAARWNAAALRLLPDAADPERRLPLLIALGTALGTAGRFHESRSTLERAYELTSAADVGRRAQLVGMIARTETALGHGGRAREMLEEALARADPESTEAVVVGLESARYHLMVHEWEAAADVARRARAVARGLGNPDLLLFATALSALMEAFRSEGGSADGLALTDEAAAIVDALADDELGPWGQAALLSLSHAEASYDRARDVERHVERGLRVSRKTGHGALTLDFMHILSISLLLQGKLAEARSVADATVETARALNHDQLLAGVEGTRCWIASLQGQTHDALRAGKCATEAVARTPHSRLAWHARTNYGAALLDAGQPELARTEILAAGGTGLSDVPPPVRPVWYRTLTEIEVATGNLDAAEAMARRAEAVAAALDLDTRTGHARYARACVELARGETSAAAAAAVEAVGHYQASGAIIEAGRAGVLAGRALAAAGDVAEAETQLTLTLAVCESRGAAQLAERAATELRRLGKPVTRARRRRRPTGQGVDALTRRELEVAELVADGRSNREIAEALSVSQKTVETHLSQVFVKLGVSSRLAAAVKIGGSEAARG